MGLARSTSGASGDRLLVEVVRTVILLALALVIMFSMDVRMALIILAFMPVMIAYTMFFYRRVGARFLEAD